MKLRLGPEIVSSYKRLSYTPWFALAEFVDNATQAYLNNRKLLDSVYADEGTTLTVNIEYGKEKGVEFLRITDNSIGMSKKELQEAVTVGKPPVNTSGRSKYGLGMKTGASWLGDLWTVRTKKYGESYEHFVSIDVPSIAHRHLDVHHKQRELPLEKHYTIIEVRQLHRRLMGRTLGKVKNYLKSIYRIDISETKLQLLLNGELLQWSYDELFNRLLTDKRGQHVKRDFKFRIGKKEIHGWAGVLERGSRKDAGFTIIQANRVITGWPDSYRPETLFGPQEGGSNDLVNQRLVGEIFLEGFDVSHTKDEILFDDSDKEKLESSLLEKLGDLRAIALSFRKNADERLGNDIEISRKSAVNKLEREVSSVGVRDFLATYELPNVRIWRKTNQSLKDSIVRRFKPEMKVSINDLDISLYLSEEDISPNDPYVIIESTENKKAVVVIVNVLHPHWLQLTNEESILNFIRHCVYDGVSEWKAFTKTGKLEPDTIKLIKDNLLRIPFTMKK